MNVFLCHEMTESQKRWALFRSVCWGLLAGVAIGANLAASMIRQVMP